MSGGFPSPCHDVFIVETNVASLKSALNNTYLNKLPYLFQGIFQTLWWRHQMETFSALLDLCAGNSPVYGEFPVQRPVTRSFDVFFDLYLIKRLRKHSRGWWFETLSRPLWRHCNDSPEIQCVHHIPLKFALVKIMARGGTSDKPIAETLTAQYNHTYMHRETPISLHHIFCLVLAKCNPCH